MGKRSKGKQTYPKKSGKSFESIRTAGCPQTVQDKVRKALHRELDKEHRDDKKAAVEEAFDDGINLGQETRASEGIAAMVASVGKVAAEAIRTMERSSLAIVDKASKRKVGAETSAAEEDEKEEPALSRFEKIAKDGGGFWLRRISEKVDTLKESELGKEGKHIAKHEGVQAIGGALGGPIGSVVGRMLAPHLSKGTGHNEHMEEQTEAIHGETKAQNEKLDKLDEDIMHVKDAIVHQTKTDAASDEAQMEQMKDENKAVVKKLKQVDESVDGVRRRLSFQSLMGFFGDVFGSVFGKMGSMLGGAGGLGGMLKLLRSGGLVAGAGALGYGVGRMLDKGVEKLTGDTIGGNIYDFFNEDDNREQQALQFFQERGWSKQQAAGITANLRRESNFDPSGSGDGGKAYGIAQWHPDRQAEFERKNKKAIQGSSFEEQLDFVDYELRHGNEQKAGKMLKQARNEREAAEVVSEFYERPGDREGEKLKRGIIAKELYNEMQRVPTPQPAEREEKDAVDYDKLANSIARVMPKPAPAMSQPSPSVSTSASKMPMRPEDLGLAIANTGVFV